MQKVHQISFKGQVKDYLKSVYYVKVSNLKLTKNTWMPIQGED